MGGGSLLEKINLTFKMDEGRPKRSVCGDIEG